ncbi:MAG: radical SAM protein [Candidatus Odinarchaeia archaeon]
MWFTRKTKHIQEVSCRICGSKNKVVSGFLEVCRDCIIQHPDKALPLVSQKHNIIRSRFSQSEIKTTVSEGLKCYYCGNECVIDNGESGICGLVENQGGKLKRIAGLPDSGLLSFYYDPLPTNCVADFVCPGGTGCGYPKYAYSDGPEYGYQNLAVFYQSCNFNCVFCQNWSYRIKTDKPTYVTSKQLADRVKSNVSCICFFGGDPTPQIDHSIKTAQIAIKAARSENRILRVCWETNGGMNQKKLDKILEIALETGGCVKFDLKFYSENLNKALCGVSNKTTLSNFAIAAEKSKLRETPPLVVASTLLIPGYVTPVEVKKIADYIASLNSKIPYRLLAFSPQFYMDDIPPTSREHALKCYQAAVEAGCENVEIGNELLLSNVKYPI